jgi:hypothetical protein
MSFRTRSTLLRAGFDEESITAKKTELGTNKLALFFAIKYHQKLAETHISLCY